MALVSFDPAELDWQVAGLLEDLLGELDLVNVRCDRVASCANGGQESKGCAGVGLNEQGPLRVGEDRSVHGGEIYPNERDYSHTKGERKKPSLPE